MDEFNVSAPEERVELRGYSPRETVDVLDAVSGARRISRMDLVNEILGEWVQAKLHESILIQRVTRRNPAQPETDGSAPERGSRG